MGCVDIGFWDNPYWVDENGYPCGNNGDSPIPRSSPVSGGSGVKIASTPVSGNNVFVGQTTLDKILNSVQTGLALLTGAQYIPTTAHPLQNVPTSNAGNDAQYQQMLLQQQMLQQQQSAGGKFGDSIQKFVSENTMLILVGVGALVLFKSGRK